MRDVRVKLPKPHLYQAGFIRSPAKRIIIKAGRRSGKTVGVAIRAVQRFLSGRRELYGAPTVEQIDRFWAEVTRALAPLIEIGLYKKNETEHVIERPGTEQRIKAKTVWNADTLRGDYADDLYLDEWQLMNEDAWEVVGAPMLLDNNGDAVFIYTPPSLRAEGVSKAHDPRHASKMFQLASKDATGRWATFHFTSHDNPYIDQDALREITKDMSKASYRQEILAEDDELEAKQLIYWMFNDALCRINRFPIPSNYLHYTGHDFGGANPAAVFIAQDPATGLFYVYGEYLPGGGRSTAEHVVEFKELTKDLRILKRVGGSHQEEEIRQGYGAHGWVITEPLVRDVNYGIDRVRGLFENNKVFIFNDLPHIFEELADYSWKLDADGKLTDEIRNKSSYHLMDAMRYILSDFVPQTVSVDTRQKVKVKVFR